MRALSAAWLSVALVSLFASACVTETEAEIVQEEIAAASEPLVGDNESAEEAEADFIAQQGLANRGQAKSTVRGSDDPARAP
jgi:hypothetical protein